MTTNTLIASLDASGEIPAYLIRPAGNPRGAIIVVQEIFGVNTGIRRKVQDWAAAGYLAIAPDIFWRQKPGIDLNPDDPVEFDIAIGHMMKHDFGRGLEDIKAVIAWARDQGVKKVGLVGFCMGGKIAYESACGTDIDAAVAYYGVGIDQMLDRSDGITGQLMLHIPTNDGFVPAEAQKAIHQAFDHRLHIVLHDYKGLDHGFADTYGARRDDEGARLADDRTAAFFAECVG